MQLWQHDKMQWMREEVLASIRVAKFVELPEKKLVVSHAAVDEDGYFARLQRQLSNAKVHGLHALKLLPLIKCLRTSPNTW